MSVKIVILDSGLNYHNCFDCHEGNLERFGFEYNNNKIVVNEHGIDEVGHGTAVTNAITSVASKCDITMFKIMKTDNILHEDSFIEYMEFICAHVKCDILHISAGLNECIQRERLQMICKKINERGTIIVAAFSNNGFMTYPAVFPSVIGVDFNLDIVRPSEWIYISNSPVNIWASGTNHRLAWLDNTYINIAGASFAAAFLTGNISKALHEGVKKTEIDRMLFQNAVHVYHAPTVELEESMYKINNAVVFPFNKENHSIIKFQDLLFFQITKLLDIKYSGKVNNNIKQLEPHFETDFMIENIDTLDWGADFDTFIMGHMDLIHKACKKDYKEFIIRNCLLYKKNLYSYDILTDDIKNEFLVNGLRLYYPYIGENNIRYHQMGKLYSASIPVIGVFGSSSKQGKWTLQLSIVREMRKRGYETGIFGTEPTAPLFGQKYPFPFGYHSCCELSVMDCISTANYYLNCEDLETRDLIVIGGQSHSVLNNLGGIAVHPVQQHEFISGCMPDGVFLCINPWDSEEYVERMVQYFKSYFNIKVLGLVLSPKSTYEEWTNWGMKIQKFDNDDIQNILEQRLKLPVFKLNDENTKLICDLIESYFS